MLREIDEIRPIPCHTYSPTNDIVLHFFNTRRCGSTIYSSLSENKSVNIGHSKMIVSNCPLHLPNVQIFIVKYIILKIFEFSVDIIIQTVINKYSSKIFFFSSVGKIAEWFNWSRSKIFLYNNLHKIETLVGYRIVFGDEMWFF